MTDKLKERDRKILEAIIKDYIETGMPVGSRRVTKKYDLNVSPATVRNVMADLEEMHLLEQPHTSAGRVPTDEGYRFYVDSLLEVRELSRVVKDEIRKKYSLANLGLDEIMQETTRVLSFLSKYTGIISTPRIQDATFRHLEFLKLRKGTILVILVTESGFVQNKIIEDEDDLSPDDLMKLSNYINDVLKNLSIQEAKERILAEMKKEKAQYDRLMSKALALSHEALEDQEEGTVIIDSQIHILDHLEFKDVDKMKAVFKAFEEKNIIIRLLDKTIGGEGIQIFIGAETEDSEIQDCTIIASPYQKEGITLGALGVIGPTRMSYNTVIPIVDYTAKVVTRIIEEL